MSAASLPQGAYGLVLSGLESTALVTPAPAAWTPISVERRSLEGAPDETTRDEGVHELAFEAGWAVRLEREARRATFFVPGRLESDELVHPHLTPVALSFAEWLGHTALHAGAFVHAGGAWAVLARREGGKSTTLAALAGRGVEILTDDVLVVTADDDAFAGPRCIDLRADVRTRADTVAVRNGAKKRLALRQVEPAVPLRGFFVLEWGERLGLEPLSPAERLVAVAARARPAAVASGRVLELARLPAWRVTRPHTSASVESVCDRLLDAAAD